MSIRTMFHTMHEIKVPASWKYLVVCDMTEPRCFFAEDISLESLKNLPFSEECLQDAVDDHATTFEVITKPVVDGDVTGYIEIIAEDCLAAEVTDWYDFKDWTRHEIVIKDVASDLDSPFDDSEDIEDTDDSDDD